MKINEIAFFAYAVSDMKKSRAFYEGVLGLNQIPNSTVLEIRIGLNMTPARARSESVVRRECGNLQQRAHLLRWKWITLMKHWRPSKRRIFPLSWGRTICRRAK